MTWPEVVEDLETIWNWICWLADGLGWLAVRAVFALSCVGLPVCAIALVIAAWYLKWKSENETA